MSAAAVATVEARPAFGLNTSGCRAQRPPSGYKVPLTFEHSSRRPEEASDRQTLATKLINSKPAIVAHRCTSQRQIMSLR